MSLEMELALADKTNIINNTQKAVHLMEGVRGFQRELKLQDDSYLKTVVQIREYDEGDFVLLEATHSILSKC